MRRYLIIWLLLGLAAIAVPVAAQGGGSFRVIVNPSNPVSEMSRIEVSRLFLKKTTSLERGTKVLPVDQLPASAVRIDFSQTILRKDVATVKSYWQVQVFSGIATPPPELASDDEVLSYVRSNAGAIGYVSRSASTGDGVRVLKITG